MRAVAGHCDGAGRTGAHSRGKRHARGSRAEDRAGCPGGFGTIEEIFEALTWAQIELHEKPCVLLNSDGYYDYLFKFLDHAVAEGLLKGKNRALALAGADRRIGVANDLDGLGKKRRCPGPDLAGLLALKP